jgi:enamine deaminase RidA (YjgF/YER057c/UK114 family)
MGAIEIRLKELGYALPPVVAPLAAYVPAVRSGNYVYVSGQLPMVDGVLMAKGLVAQDPTDEIIEGWVIDGDVIDIETAKACAARCALNAMAAIGTVVDDLDEVVRIVKVTGFVAGVDGFTAHPLVLDGASELLGDVWLDKGRHARAAVGVASLPLGAPVELELIAELSGG